MNKYPVGLLLRLASDAIEVLCALPYMDIPLYTPRYDADGTLAPNQIPIVGGRGELIGTTTVSEDNLHRDANIEDLIEAGYSEEFENDKSKGLYSLKEFLNIYSRTSLDGWDMSLVDQSKINLNELSIYELKRFAQYIEHMHTTVTLDPNEMLEYDKNDAWVGIVHQIADLPLPGDMNAELDRNLAQSRAMEATMNKLQATVSKYLSNKDIKGGNVWLSSLEQYAGAVTKVKVLEQELQDLAANTMYKTIDLLHKRKEQLAGWKEMSDNWMRPGTQAGNTTDFDWNAQIRAVEANLRYSGNIHAQYSKDYYGRHVTKLKVDGKTVWKHKRGLQEGPYVEKKYLSKSFRLQRWWNHRRPIVTERVNTRIRNILTKFGGKVKASAIQQGQEIGEGIQLAAEELVGKPFANMVQYNKWKDTLANLDANKIYNTLNEAYKDMDNAQTSLRSSKPPSEIQQEFDYAKKVWRNMWNATLQNEFELRGDTTKFGEVWTPDSKIDYNALEGPDNVVEPQYQPSPSNTLHEYIISNLPQLCAGYHIWSTPTRTSRAVNCIR